MSTGYVDPLDQFINALVSIVTARQHGDLQSSTQAPDARQEIRQALNMLIEQQIKQHEDMQRLTRPRT